MTLNESITFVWGLGYAAMMPLLHFAPEFFFKVILLDANIEYYTEDNIKLMDSVFISLAVVATPAYIIAAINKYTVYIHITLAQRLTVVLATVLLSGMVIKQEIFEGGYFLYTMFLVADCVPAALQGWLTPSDGTQQPQKGLATHVQPNGFTIIRNSIANMYRSTPANPYKKSLRLESYLGMTFGFIACIYAAIVSDIKLSLVTTMITTILPYFWLWFIAHEPSITSYVSVKIQRIAISAALLYYAFILDFGVMNVVYKVQAVNIVTGVFSSKAAAFVLALSSFYVYKLECDYVLTLESGPFYWLCAWGAMTSITSYAWLYLFYDQYNIFQQKRIKGTQWQDNILALFSIVVAGALDKADCLRSGTLGELVVYLLPFGVLYFALHSKLLTHLWVGSPFHPSWWLYRKRDVPTEEYSERYAPNDLINKTFGFATLIATIVLTSYAWYSINSAVGFDSFSFSSGNTWKFAVSHGILFVFHSGLWMIFASSGVPRIANKGFLSVFPPTIKPVQLCEPEMCKKIHRADLVIGHFFLFFGAFWLGDGSDVETSPQLSVTKACAAIAWMFSIGFKLYIHREYGNFQAPYFEGKEAEKKKQR